MWTYWPSPYHSTAVPHSIQHHTHQSTEEGIGTSDDQSMTFQQENYEDYMQYEMEQEYEGNMEEYDGLFLCSILKVWIIENHFQGPVMMK